MSVYAASRNTAMGYVVSATVFREDGTHLHTATIRWRHDDPWGTFWRALHAVAGPFVPDEIDRTKSAAVVTICMQLSFEPDAEDKNFHLACPPPHLTERERARLPTGVKT